MTGSLPFIGAVAMTPLYRKRHPSIIVPTIRNMALALLSGA